MRVAPFAGFIALLVSVSAGIGGAQPSTNRVAVAVARPRLTFELSGGTEALSIRVVNSASGAGDVRMLAGGARWLLAVAPISGFRVEGIFVERHTAYTTFNQSGQAVRRDRVDDVRALAISDDVGVTVRAIEVTGYLGYGIAPSVSSSGQRFIGDGRRGKVWIGGLAVRTRHFVIEQRLIGLLEGSIVQDQREYFPLTAGVRIPIGASR